MAKETKNNKAAKRPIEQYDHKHPKTKRLNNPPVGLVTPATDNEEPKKTYSYDPHLDPQLVWAGKEERTSFEVPSVSLHVPDGTVLACDCYSAMDALEHLAIGNVRERSLGEIWRGEATRRLRTQFWDGRLNAAAAIIIRTSACTATSRVKPERA